MRRPRSSGTICSGYLDGDSIQARSFNVLDRLAHVLERDSHTADFATWSSMVS